MNLTWHIMKKDLRGLRWFLLAFGLLQLTQTDFFISVWLADAPLDADAMKKKLAGLRMLGDPYTDADIDGVAAALQGKTELDAVVAYLQGLGKHAPKREAATTPSGGAQ